MKKKLSFLAKYIRFKLKAWLWGKLTPDTLGIVVATDFGAMICDPLDNHVSRQLIKWGTYNPNDINRYISLSEGMGSLLVVGAHIGSVALQMVDHFSEIVCIEANPKTYQLLQMNIKLRNVEHKVTALNTLVTADDMDVDFICSRENTAGSKVQPAYDDVNFLYDSPDLITLPGRSLDSMFEGRRFDLILMDIEGGEFDAIMGAQTLLRSCGMFVVEFVPNHLARVANRSTADFAQLLINLDFDNVEFPRFEASGPPLDCLLKILNQVIDAGEYEDGLIFTRAKWPPVNY